MITDIDSVLKTGEVWPPESEKERLEEYDKSLNLLLGRHGKVFNLRSMPTDYALVNLLEHFRNPYVSGALHSIQSVQIHISVPIPWIVGCTYSDLLFAEGLRPRVEGQSDDDFEIDSTVQEIMNDSELQALNLEQAVFSSALGDCVYEIFREIDGRVLIESVDPRYYFPVLQRESRKQVKEVLIAYVFEVGKKEFLRVKIFRPGMIEHRVLELVNSRIGETQRVANFGFDSDFEELPQSLENKIPVVHAPNIRLGGFWGVSDLAFGMLGLIDEIDNRLSQNANILDRHADPKIAADRSIVDPETNKVDLKSGFIPVRDGGVTPSYLTWDSKLTDSMSQLDRAVSLFCLGTGLPPEVFLSTKLGHAEQSGSRMRMAWHPAVLRTRRKRLYFTPALRDVFHVAQIFKGLEVREVTDLGWSDGLPVDYKEQTEAEAQRLAAGFQTTIDAIMRVDRVTRAAAVKKAEAVIEESRARVAEFVGSESEPESEEEE